jgi:hypothetical protein
MQARFLGLAALHEAEKPQDLKDESCATNPPFLTQQDKNGRAARLKSESSGNAMAAMLRSATSVL